MHSSYLALNIITGSSPPQNFTVEVLNSTAVELFWRYPGTPNGEIRGYDILYNEFPAMEVEEISVNITLDSVNDASDQTAVVAGLVPFTEYRFGIRAFSFGDQNEQPYFLHIGITTEQIIVRTAEDGRIIPN